ncbi:MAG: sulfatase-like hydrolase/transferase [Opitutales bacterium]|nr:sulfatase-like hydrolase/transferase [Opitutales bacterium]
MATSYTRFPLIALAALFACSATIPLQATDKPNVIIIYTDDQGTVDLSCYGTTDIYTPHIDSLAKRGVRFQQMYSPSAICSASRSGLMTGRFPARAGVPGNVSSEEGVPGIPTGQVTIAEVMKDAGYKTGHIGKWHLGYTPETMPNAQGFDYSWGHMGGCIDNYSHFFFWKGPNRHDLWRNGEHINEDGFFFQDSMVREINGFITQNREKPFFVYWALNSPHYPLQGTAKWRDYYKDIPSPRSKYNAFVSTLDEKIGEMLTHLDQIGLTDNTIIIFQSDHGHSTEERTFHGGGSAGIYRGAKGCLFEGGIRVPSIVTLPGVIPENQVRDQMVTGVDWFPTLAEFCGIELPGHHIDGKSIKDVILDNGANSPHDTFYWQLGKGKTPEWVVREGNWKLHGNPKDNSQKAPITKNDKLFLANLAMDPTEMTNLAFKYPEVVKRLSDLQSEYDSSIQQTLQSER